MSTDTSYTIGTLHGTLDELGDQLDKIDAAGIQWDGALELLVGISEAQGLRCDGDEEEAIAVVRADDGTLLLAEGTDRWRVTVAPAPAPATLIDLLDIPAPAGWTVAVEAE